MKKVPMCYIGVTEEKIENLKKEGKMRKRWCVTKVAHCMWLFFCYTIQLNTIKLCTKFQNHKSSSC